MRGNFWTYEKILKFEVKLKKNVLKYYVKFTKISENNFRIFR